MICLNIVKHIRTVKSYPGEKKTHNPKRELRESKLAQSSLKIWVRKTKNKFGPDKDR